MTKRVFFDGLNLSQARGTGIATYTRILAELIRQQGDQVGIVHSSPRIPVRRSRWQRWSEDAADHLRCYASFRPVPVDWGRLEAADITFASRNLFKNARRFFGITGSFVDLKFETPPDILHCTYPMPIRCAQAVSLCTIHDLVPLRLAAATTDDRKEITRLLRQVARQADHIITVSEHSRRDIIELLGVDEDRVTNTYQAVSLPAELLARPEADIVAEISDLGLEYQAYLLFFGALEPKKNVARLLEAYVRSGIDIPLVIVSGAGWRNEAENRLIDDLAKASGNRQRVIKLDYAPREILTSIIRGARAVVFPSLYEGFGLPILESMLLGTPVVTSNVSSLPEIAGDAALTVDPYNIEDIAAAIRTITADADLRAELKQRGIKRAAKFSIDRYRRTMADLYARLS